MFETTLSSICHSWDFPSKKSHPFLGYPMVSPWVGNPKKIIPGISVNQPFTLAVRRLGLCRKMSFFHGIDPWLFLCDQKWWPQLKKAQFNWAQNWKTIHVHSGILVQFKLACINVAYVICNYQLINSHPNIYVMSCPIWMYLQALSGSLSWRWKTIAFKNGKSSCLSSINGPLSIANCWITRGWPFLQLRVYYTMWGPQDS